MALTPKQEAFVQAYHRLSNQRAAYREAYDAENMSDPVVDNKASLLLKKGEVRVRLDEMRERVAKKTEISVETITGMLAKAYKRADDVGQASAAVAAAMGLAKLHGLITDKQQTTHKIDPITSLLSQINERVYPKDDA